MGLGFARGGAISTRGSLVSRRMLKYTLQPMHEGL